MNQIRGGPGRTPRRRCRLRRPGRDLVPTRRYDDKRYWAIYARAEQHGMIALFHTGIKNRPRPEVPEDVSVDRMRATTLDLICRRFPS